ncbi:MAG: ATP synthase subunit I [Desulfarculaceae bacterium]
MADVANPQTQTEEGLEALVKSTLRVSLAITLAISLALLGLGLTTWAKGLALGGIASALNFFLMARLLPRSIDPRRRRAEGFSLLSIALRFSVMGAALALALVFPRQIAVAACALGLFMVQFCLVFNQLIGKRPTAKA